MRVRRIATTTTLTTVTTTSVCGWCGVSRPTSRPPFPRRLVMGPSASSYAPIRSGLPVYTRWPRLAGRGGIRRDGAGLSCLLGAMGGMGTTAPHRRIQKQGAGQDSLPSSPYPLTVWLAPDRFACPTPHRRGEKAAHNASAKHKTLSRCLLARGATTTVGEEARKLRHMFPTNPFRAFSPLPRIC